MEDEVVDNELRKLFVDSKGKAKLSEINELLLSSSKDNPNANCRQGLISSPTEYRPSHLDLLYQKYQD